MFTQRLGNDSISTAPLQDVTVSGGSQIVARYAGVLPGYRYTRNTGHLSDRYKSAGCLTDLTSAFNLMSQ